ncbi:hypothetical protein Nepgr_028354 [Nepenthes gracilis]|uniref:Uncharacterized protein n=1 Tax=Nepenthes gracilis TaxID=150966 RepID=A0AAD3TCY5_NEPGR|nr:hypothetical protein Nepgr_028354 [Nepenthes gracilis]
MDFGLNLGPIGVFDMHTLDLCFELDADVADGIVVVLGSAGGAIGSLAWNRFFVAYFFAMQNCIRRPLLFVGSKFAYGCRRVFSFFGCGIVFFGVASDACILWPWGPESCGVFFCSWFSIGITSRFLDVLFAGIVLNRVEVLMPIRLILPLGGPCFAV